MADFGALVWVGKWSVDLTDGEVMALDLDTSHWRTLACWLRWGEGQLTAHMAGEWHG